MPVKVTKKDLTLLEAAKADAAANRSDQEKSAQAFADHISRLAVEHIESIGFPLKITAQPRMLLPRVRIDHDEYTNLHGVFNGSSCSSVVKVEVLGLEPYFLEVVVMDQKVLSDDPQVYGFHVLVVVKNKRYQIKTVGDLLSIKKISHLF